MKGDLLYKKALKEARSKTCDLVKTYDLLNKAHMLGNHKATYAIGTWYLFGKHLRKDYKKAVMFLKLATEGGVPEAYYDLAVCYETGKGVKKDKQQAFLNYLSASLLGDKHSVYEVGRCYYYGIGIPKDRLLSERWLEAAAFWHVN